MMHPVFPAGQCCDRMKDAIKWKYFEVRNEEVMVLRNLKKHFPDAKTGNVLTGEVYDPGKFEMGLAFDYCPFCGELQKEKEAEEEGWDEP